MQRLTYLNGLKGWCAISACLIHFLLIFAIDGYIGWKCLPEASLQPFSYYWNWFPYSAFLNTSFPLYLFFAIISYLVCYLFFKKNDENKIKQNIIMRYFRLLPLVLVLCLASYLLLKFKLCPLQEFYDITGNTWGYARLEESYTLFDALKISFFTAFFEGTQLVSAFWCLHYIFLGSILVYITMLIYNKLSNKTLFFIFLVLLFFFIDQTYLSFIAGIIAAIITNKEPAITKSTGVLLIIGGCVLGLFPSVLLPKFINIVTLYAIGTIFILVGTHCCFSNSRLLCNSFIEFLGKESFSTIAWQMLVLQSLNIFLHNYFYKLGMDNIINVSINLVVNIGVSLLLVWIHSKTITPLTNHLCSRVRMLLWENNK